MVKYHITILLLLSLGLMTACQGDPPSPFSPEEVITSYSDDGSTVDLMRLSRLNLALAETGQLADKVFHYTQAGSDGILVPWNMTAEAGERLSDAYWSMGHVAYSQRMAFEANVMDERDVNPRMVKRLIETNLVFGAYPVARKYIDILGKEKGWKKVAEEYRHFLNDDAAIEADPVLGQKRKCVPEKDFIRKVYERVGNFLGVSIGEGYQQMFDFNFNLFCRTFDLPVLPTHNALKILTQSGYIEFVEEIETQSRVMILARKEQLYDLDTETPGADQVLQAILRLYTGLFADYVFINEDVIAFRTGLKQETIYNALLELTRMHILHYVPRKRTPYIIYTTSREEPQHVLIPKVIYEDLRQRMNDRIEATINYAYSDTGCRERMLLGYFGEKSEDECGHCDLCIDRRKRADHTPDDVQQGILYMAGLRPRRLEEFLNTLSFPKDEIVSMLSFLVDEGFVEHLDDDTYRAVK